jgi:GxxExxY protein
MTEDEITEMILKCAFIVHSALGPGLLESAYKACLAYELRLHGLYVETEKPMPLIYKEIKLDTGYRMDLLVERKVVVEVKVADAFTDVNIAQGLTYLRLGSYRVGLLLNFKVMSMKNGIKRLIL